MTEGGVTFGLVVTGKGEERFLPKLFQSLWNVGPFRFEVIHRIEQLSPRRSQSTPRLVMPSVNAYLPTRDQDLGLKVRGYLQNVPGSMVMRLLGGSMWSECFLTRKLALPCGHYSHGA